MQTGKVRHPPPPRSSRWRKCRCSIGCLGQAVYLVAENISPTLRVHVQQGMPGSLQTERILERSFDPTKHLSFLRVHMVLGSNSRTAMRRKKLILSRKDIRKIGVGKAAAVLASFVRYPTTNEGLLLTSALYSVVSMPTKLL